MGNPGWIPGLERSSGEGNGNPLQYSCLENSMDWGAWRATVHGVAKNHTQLSDLSLLHKRENVFMITDIIEKQSAKSRWWETLKEKWFSPLNKMFVRSLLSKNFARSILSKRGIEINSLNKSNQKYVNNGKIWISPISRLKKY